MRWKIIVVPVVAILGLAAAVCARAQVTHAGTEGRFPLTVGFGVSNYSIDWGPGKRMTGIGASVDWRLRGMPHYLNGLSVSAEGQWINWNKPDIGKHELQVGSGGPSYHFQKWDRIQPYVKYFIGFGGIYFTDTRTPYYSHDTRVIYAPGIGADLRVWNNLGVRVDYEYQFWPNLFGNTSNPNGFTIGGIWDFGGRGAAR
jgi:hypothetical protein